MTGLSRAEKRALKRQRKQAIRAERRRQGAERKAAEKRVKAAKWRDVSRGAEQDQGDSQKR